MVRIRFGTWSNLQNRRYTWFLIDLFDLSHLSPFLNTYRERAKKSLLIKKLDFFQVVGPILHWSPCKRFEKDSVLWKAIGVQKFISSKSECEARMSVSSDGDFDSRKRAMNHFCLSLMLPWSSLRNSVQLVTICKIKQLKAKSKLHLWPTTQWQSKNMPTNEHFGRYFC